MKSIQKIILFAVFALAMVGCKKDNQLISSSTITDTKSTSEVSTHNHTQTSKRKCASKVYMEQKMQDPVYRANHEKSMAAFERNIRSRTAQSRSSCTSPTILPVAVHYQGISNPDKACLIQAAKEAIAVLNADFQGKNSDIVQWDNTASSYYPGISNGDACIGFQLGSKNHPSGFGLNDGDLAVTINKTNSDASNEWKGYINIFVGDADGSLGYAPLGGNGLGDGMMISQSAFTIGTSCGSVQGNAPNDLGRTLTHEMGHYLNLDHVWGDGGCNADDQVTDTPNQAEPNYGCPTLGNTKGCSSEALHMNFMDYADDACMYMFSAGQAARMEAWVNSGLLNNLKKAVEVFGGSNEGNTDGNSNNNEDGEETTVDNTDAEDDEIDEESNTEQEDTDAETTNQQGVVEINVTLDNYGSETSFAIEDEDGTTIMTWGSFEDNAAGTTINAQIDLSAGLYTFIIFDDFGDGICCYEGDGNWELIVDGAPVKTSNGEFGYWEAFDFAIGNARLKAPAHRKDSKDLTQLAKKQKVSLK